MKKIPYSGKICAFCASMLFLCPPLGVLWYLFCPNRIGFWGLIGFIVFGVLAVFLLLVFMEEPPPKNAAERIFRQWRDTGRQGRSGGQDDGGEHNTAVRSFFETGFALSVLWIPISPILGIIGYLCAEPRLGEAATWVSIGGIVGAFIPITLMVILIAIFVKTPDAPDAPIVEQSRQPAPSRGITLGKVAKFTVNAVVLVAWAAIIMCAITPNDKKPKN